MSETTAYPLSWPAGWPRTPSNQRKRANFGKQTTQRSADGQHSWSHKGSLSVAQATARLVKEICQFTRTGKSWRINPNTVVISTNLVLRNDGLPRSGQREPEDPGVAVYFNLDGEPYCLPCDRWDRIADNIAAIAAHIGAMRGMERWGVGDIRAHFAGFKSLPSPDAVSATSWRDVLGYFGSNLSEAKKLYMALRSEHHPDRGGSVEMFNQVQKAWEQAQEALG